MSGEPRKVWAAGFAPGRPPEGVRFCGISAPVARAVPYSRLEAIRKAKLTGSWREMGAELRNWNQPQLSAREDWFAGILDFQDTRLEGLPGWQDSRTNSSQKGSFEWSWH